MTFESFQSSEETSEEIRTKKSGLGGKLHRLVQGTMLAGGALAGEAAMKDLEAQDRIPSVPISEHVLEAKIPAHNNEAVDSVLKDFEISKADGGSSEEGLYNIVNKKTGEKAQVFANSYAAAVFNGPEFAGGMTPEVKAMIQKVLDEEKRLKAAGIVESTPLEK
ncbi:MAG: hypothetical protein JWN50_714 [Parcubacteria group bacterium]|nr:hypothetical protein [Parcubacteria group bacterium]